VIAAVIDELEREHASLDALWQRLRQSLSAMVAGKGSLDRDGLERFAWLYRKHMENEAGAVLPFAREALDRADRAALAARMAERRKGRELR
jgi:hemerythrin-like domain-containing protein